MSCPICQEPVSLNWFSRTFFLVEHEALASDGIGGTHPVHWTCQRGYEQIRHNNHCTVNCGRTLDISSLTHRIGNAAKQALHHGAAVSMIALSLGALEMAIGTMEGVEGSHGLSMGVGAIFAGFGSALGARKPKVDEPGVGIELNQVLKRKAKRLVAILGLTAVTTITATAAGLIPMPTAGKIIVSSGAGLALGAFLSDQFQIDTDSKTRMASLISFCLGGTTALASYLKGSASLTTSIATLGYISSATSSAITFIRHLQSPL